MRDHRAPPEQFTYLMSGTETARREHPLRDRVGRALYEEPGGNADWSSLSEERREPWRKDADRVIPIIAADYAAVVAEKRRAQEACELMGKRMAELAEGNIAQPDFDRDKSDRSLMQNNVAQLLGSPDVGALRVSREHYLFMADEIERLRRRCAYDGFRCEAAARDI